MLLAWKFAVLIEHNTIKLYWQYFHIIELSQVDNVWNAQKYT